MASAVFGEVDDLVKFMTMREHELGPVIPHEVFESNHDQLLQGISMPEQVADVNRWNRLVRPPKCRRFLRNNQDMMMSAHRFLVNKLHVSGFQ